MLTTVIRKLQLKKEPMVVQIKFLYIYRSNVTTIYNLFPSELWLVSELYSVLSRISFSFLSLFF